MGSYADRVLGTPGETPELPATPATPTPDAVAPPQDSFSYADRVISGPTDATKIGLSLDVNQNTPERAARVLRTQDRTRLPIQLVNENLDEIEHEVNKLDFDLDQFTRDNPKVSSWLAANPEHAALAKDDMKNLGTLEWMFSAPVRAFERGQERTKFRDIRYRHLMGSPMSADEMKQLGELKRKTETGSDFGAETWFGEALVGGAEFLPQLGSQYGRGAMYAAPALGAAALGSVIFPPAAPALFKAGTASAGALFTAGVIEEGFKMEAAEAFDEFLDFRDEQGKPLDENMARIAAITAGAMNSGLEALQARILLKAIPGADKLVGPLARNAVREALKSPTVLSALGGMAATYGKTLGAETLTEVVQRAITIMSGEFAKMASDENFENRSAGDIAADLAREARGAALSFAYVVAPGPVARGVIDVRAARQAQQQEQFFTALGENATQSKTRERLPEKYQELIEQMTKDGPVENLYVPVEFYQTHWESQNLDPRAVAVEMGIEQQYDEAVTTGAKLEIPTAIYARRIAPTENNTAFAKELSTGPEIMNAREADEFLKQAKEPAEEVTDTVAESAARVREDIRGQLVGVVPNDVAERYATLYESTFKSLGQRSGIDPYQLYQRYGLRIARELPDVLKRLPKLENLDVLLDRLRAGETVTMEQARGKSLLQFLKPFGLQDEGGELAARDLGKSVKGLVKPAGLSLDGAAEKAFEAGYLTAYDQNELLKAIDEELSGTPRYAQGEGDTQAQETMTALDELEKFLGQLGIDIKTMDNAALKRLITEGAKAGEGLVLAQDKNILFQPGQDIKRGLIRFGKDRQFDIELLKAADLSTFLHETGHFYFEVLGDLAEDPNASEQVKQDYQTVLDYLGVKTRAEVTVEHHEQLARSFEAYLLEGKAPSAALRGVFARFRAWLVSIYRTISKLDVELTKEVREVFDRLVATDAEIESAKAEANIQPIFSSAVEAGMTDTEFSAYRKTIEDASQAAQEELEQKLIRDFMRARKEWWKDERIKLKTEVTVEVDSQRVYKAITALQADGSVRLDRKAIMDAYGKDFVKRLPKGIAVLEGGAHADTVAEIVGYGSGQELLMDLASARPRNALIEAETDRRMHETHGDLLTDGSLHDEARKAVQNELRGKVIEAEIKALNRKAREAKPFIQAARKAEQESVTAGKAIYRALVPNLAAVRDQATRMIAAKKVREIRPMQYFAAARQASKAAMAAKDKKDYLMAGHQKGMELLNLELYREANKVKDEAESIIEYDRRFDKPATRERIGKAGGDFLGQIDALRSRFNFRPLGPKVAAKRAHTLKEWYDAQVELGFNPAIDPELFDESQRLNYREATVEELRGYRDALKTIAFIAGRQGEVEAMQRKIRRDEAVEELVSRTNETLRKLPPEKHKILKNWFDRVGDKLTDWSTTLVQVRTVANLLDGGPLGPWHDYLFSRSAEAQTAELDMNGEVLVNVGDAIEKYVEENPGRMTDMIDTALVPVGRLTRYEVISIAFNVGNESNFDKLIRGRRWQGREQEVITLLKKLDAKDLKFVQDTWNTLESIYPKLAELEKRVSGVEPEKIERRPLTLTLNSGETITLEGGYFPLKYDPDLSEAGRKQETGPMAGLVEEGYAPATTPRSHAKKRTGYAGPILLDFGYVLQRHLRGIIKDITHREFLIDANALLRDQRIKDAIKEHVGKEYTGVLHKWLKGIASDGAVSSTDGLNALDSLVESSRGRVSTVAMGYKISTMLSQLAGLPNVIEYMGKHYGAAGLRELASSFATFYSNPVRNMSHTNENSILHEIETKSGEMRHRWQNIDRDWRQRLSELSNLDIIRTTKFGINKDKIELLATKAMWDGMVFAERLITGPAWRAAYNMASKEDATEQQAIHAGNDAVLASQGGAGPKDLSAIQRQRGLMRAFTMFFTPFAAQFSRLWLIKREMGQQVGVAAKMKYAPEMVMRVMLVTALPLIMADAITGRMSKECQGKEGGEFAECLIKWASIKALFSPAVTIPLLRDVAQSAEMYATRGQIRDARFSPVFDMFSKIGKTTLYAGEAAFGDRTFEDDLFFDIFETSGYLTGLPTGQARISLEYMYDLMTDEPGADPKTPLDVMSGLAFRRPPERRE